MLQQTTEGAPVESLSGILRRTHQIYGAHLLSFLSIWVIPLASLLCVLLFLPIIPLWIWPLAFIALIVLALWAQAATYATAIAVCRGETVDVLGAYQAVWGRRLVHLLSTGILVIAGSVLGLFLFIIPGVLFFLRYGLVYPAVVVAEGVGGLHALRRCREITRGRRLKVTMLWIVFGMIEGTVYYLLKDAPEVQQLAEWALAPLAAVWGTLFYCGAVGQPLKFGQHVVSVTARSLAGGLLFLFLGLILAQPKTLSQAYKIPAGSMAPTLEVGDHILVSKFIYRFRDPERGDLIVFKYPVDESRDFIKRVVAVGGDDLVIKGRDVYVNCQPGVAGCRPMEERYAYYDERTAIMEAYGPIHVPPGSYFVMGDNRNNSQDSRYWGFVKREKITGKAFIIYWSWDPINQRVRWQRIGVRIG